MGKHSDGKGSARTNTQVFSFITNTERFDTEVLGADEMIALAYTAGAQAIRRTERRARRLAELAESAIVPAAPSENLSLQSEETAVPQALEPLTSEDNEVLVPRRRRRRNPEATKTQTPQDNKTDIELTEETASVAVIETVEKENDETPVAHEDELAQVFNLDAVKDKLDRVKNMDATLRRDLVYGAAASVAAFAGVTAGFSGTSSYDSNEHLTASLIGGQTQEIAVPASLAGSAVSEVRSAAQDIANEASTSPVCDAEGATGLRAAYVNTDNAVVWPLDSGTYRLVSPYGMRIHPIYGYGRMHNGQDMSASAGTPVYSIADGEVVSVGGGNNTVLIKHEINGEVFYSAYLHMYTRDILVSKGQVVQAGERIGAVGSYGESTGAHLHFEIHDSANNPIEPMSFMKSHSAIEVTAMCH